MGCPHNPWTGVQVGLRRRSGTGLEGPSHFEAARFTHRCVMQRACGQRCVQRPWWWRAVHIDAPRRRRSSRSAARGASAGRREMAWGGPCSGTANLRPTAQASGRVSACVPVDDRGEEAAQHQWGETGAGCQSREQLACVGPAAVDGADLAKGLQVVGVDLSGQLVEQLEGPGCRVRRSSVIRVASCVSSPLPGASVVVGRRASVKRTP